MEIKKIIISLTLAIITIFTFSKVQAMTHYQTVGTTTGLVTATALNVRQGPGINYEKVTMIYKNEYVRVFAQIGNWYVIQTNKDYIGMVSKEYVKLIYSSKTNGENTTGNGTAEKNTISITADEQEVFNLINEKRKSAGLSPLKIDNEVQKVAKDKAKDLVENNYFSHTSPTYGSPFDMLKSYKVSYKTAGENLAGNSSNIGAVNAWMNSEGHKANILNGSYNYTGIGITASPRYGKIFVQMFIGK